MKIQFISVFVFVSMLSSFSFAQNKILTAFCNVPETEAIYKESRFAVNLYPDFEIYNGPIYADGWVLKDPSAKTVSLLKYNDAAITAAGKNGFSENIAYSLKKFISDFKQKNKLNFNRFKSVYSESYIGINFAGLVIAGIDMSGFLKNTNGKAGIYVCEKIDNNAPAEIKKVLASMEDEIRSEVNRLPKEVINELKNSRKYNAKTDLLDYTVQFVNVRGISNKLPKSSPPPVEYKNLFLQFNKDVLGYYGTNPSNVPAAATKFIDRFEFPAAYAIKARYLLANRNFADVKTEVQNLLLINRKLLGGYNYDDFNLSEKEIPFYGGIQLSGNTAYLFRNLLNNTFYQLALLKYCDLATQNNERSLNGIDIYELEKSCLSSIGGLQSILSLSPQVQNGNPFLSSGYNGEVNFRIQPQFEDFNILYELMLDYFANNRFQAYAQKSKKFKNSALLSGYRHLLEKGYNIAEMSNYIGRLYDYLFYDNTCNADSANFYYRKAAEMGSMYGMRNLAFQYYFGAGKLAKDPAMAASWLQKAGVAGYNMQQDQQTMNKSFQSSYSAEDHEGNKLTVSLTDKEGNHIQGPALFKAFSANNAGDTLYYSISYRLHTNTTAAIRPNLNESYFYYGGVKLTKQENSGTNDYTGKKERLTIYPRVRPTYLYDTIEFYMYDNLNDKKMLSIQVPVMLKWAN